MAARKFIVTPAGYAVAAAALTGLTALTGCAPQGGYDTGQQQAQALANAEAAPSSAPPASTAPPQPLTESLKAVTIPKMGKVVVDQKGWVLYRFDKDTAKPPKSTCEAKCAQVWPPAITDGNPDLAGVDPAIVGTVTRGTARGRSPWPAGPSTGTSATPSRAPGRVRTSAASGSSSPRPARRTSPACRRPHPPRSRHLPPRKPQAAGADQHRQRYGY